MIVYPNIDPVAFNVFGFSVHWYGLMYFFGFLFAVIVGRRLLERPMFSSLRDVEMSDLIAVSAMGVVLGGRLGYVLFYNPGYYFDNPAEIMKVWKGGMSFHGGLLGGIIGISLYARVMRLSLLRLLDLGALLAPPGLGLGRIGNFIGGELPGRMASPDLPWAMVFQYPDSLPRHPSQLYQAFLEGVVLMVIVYIVARHRRKAGWLAGVGFISYGILRFGAEFFREPDAHLGFVFLNFSMGQLLSAPMLLIGVVLIFRNQLFSMMTRMLSGERVPAIHGDAVRGVVWDMEGRQGTAADDNEENDESAAAEIEKPPTEDTLHPCPKRDRFKALSWDDDNAVVSEPETLQPDENSPSGPLARFFHAFFEDAKGSDEEHNESAVASVEIEKPPEDKPPPRKARQSLSWDDDEADVSEEYEPTKHKESTYSSPLARFFDWFFGGVEESQHPEDKYEEQDNGADEEIDDGGDKKGFLSFLFSDEEERENRRPSNYNTNRREKRRQKKKKRSR